jgi:hypothetical protein
MTEREPVLDHDIVLAGLEEELAARRRLDQAHLSHQQ